MSPISLPTGAMVAASPRVEWRQPVQTLPDVQVSARGDATPSDFDEAISSSSISDTPSVEVPFTIDTWGTTEESRFRKLAGQSALDKLTPDEQVEFVYLTNSRRRLRTPRTGDEVIREFHVRETTNKVLEALDAYAKLIPQGKPRIVMHNRPPFKLRKHTYRKALPYLQKDFSDRCAYSLQHVQFAGGKLEVDHFNPRLKDRPSQSYDNLFPASRHCNGHKWDTWPTNSERKNGLRFLDCCKEPDYNAVIFEDTQTHELIGTTPAAKYHVIMCDLNAGHLVNERELRSKLAAKLPKNQPVTFHAAISYHKIQDVISTANKLKSLFIPEIYPPPKPIRP